MQYEIEKRVEIWENEKFMWEISTLFWVSTYFMHECF